MWYGERNGAVIQESAILSFDAMGEVQWKTKI